MANTEEFQQLYAAELDATRRREGVENLVVSAGSLGVGASGAGVEVVIETLRWISDDVARMALWGGVIRLLIDRIRARRGGKGSVCVEDEKTLGSIAASNLGDAETSSGCRFVGSRLMTTQEGLGSDERQIVGCTFMNEAEGRAILVFLSPSGMLLGRVDVPVELFFTRDGLKRRSQEEVLDDFKQWNHGSEFLGKTEPIASDTGS